MTLHLLYTYGEIRKWLWGGHLRPLTSRSSRGRSKSFRHIFCEVFNCLTCIFIAVCRAIACFFLNSVNIQNIWSRSFESTTRYSIAHTIAPQSIDSSIALGFVLHKFCSQRRASGTYLTMD